MGRNNFELIVHLAIIRWLPCGRRLLSSSHGWALKVAENPTEIKTWLSKETWRTVLKKLNYQEQLWISPLPELLKLESSFGIGKSYLSLIKPPNSWWAPTPPFSRIAWWWNYLVNLRKLNSPSLSFWGGFSIYFDPLLTQPLYKHSLISHKNRKESKMTKHRYLISITRCEFQFQWTTHPFSSEGHWNS